MNIGIVGCGSIAKIMANTINKLNNSEIVLYAVKYHLAVKKIQFVYSNLNESPIIVLVLLVKDGKFGTKIGPPVSIKNAQTYQNIFKE